ncbi:MAG: hypothetical protein ACRDPO_22350, partial [Streptosporangiaceae bacterium]
MIGLDTAGLVVIAGQVLGIGPDAALARIDLPAARAALAEAALAEAAQAGAGPLRPGRDAAAGACARLMHALLRHRPFPWQAEQLAVAAGLQYLSLNGWRADLDPPAAAVVVVEALASGRLSPADAATWLSARLSPRPAPRLLAFRARGLARRVPRPRPGRRRPVRARTRLRALASLMLTIALGSLALLAAANLVESTRAADDS